MTDDALDEELSAFMDGELDADRARFLQQRLRHDVALRDRWERWQLLSSAMRRQAQPVPADFADRVARAIEAEAAPVATTYRSRGLRWAGGAALAASLAVASVFVFDAMNQPQQLPHQVVAVAPRILPIERTVLALPEPVVKLPIPVEAGVVTAFHSPLRPVLVAERTERPNFSPFPQPYAIDPELEAYLQSQKSGRPSDVFTQDVINRPGGSDGVRTVSWPEEDQH